MNILIVGSTSVIARTVAKSLKQIGTVKLAGRRSADLKYDLTQWDKPLPKNLGSFDTILHLAADFGGESDLALKRAELVNAVGTLAVCQLANHTRAKHLILMSSVSTTFRPDNPYYNIYAISKRHGEELAEYFCSTHNITLTILRPTQIYDARGKCRNHQPLIYHMADKAEAGKQIQLFGNNDPKRNYLHITDFVEIVHRVVHQRLPGTFICANPKSVTLSQVAKAAFNAFNQPVNITFKSDEPNMHDLSIIEDYTLFQRINYWPQIDIKEGLRQIRNYRKQD